MGGGGKNVRASAARPHQEARPRGTLSFFHLLPAFASTTVPVVKPVQVRSEQGSRSDPVVGRSPSVPRRSGTFRRWPEGFASPHQPPPCVAHTPAPSLRRSARGTAAGLNIPYSTASSGRGGSGRASTPPLGL